MKVSVETQVGDITDAARARIAMVRPILVAMVHALKRERVERFGGYYKITLADLAGNTVRAWATADSASSTPSTTQSLAGIHGFTPSSAACSMTSVASRPALTRFSSARRRTARSG